MTSTVTLNFNMKVKKMDIVGNWDWDCSNDSCAICRNNIDDTCISCETKSCETVIGECGHCFHYHCIKKWLDTNNYRKLCPLCKQNWKYKLIDNNNSPH